MEEKNKIKLLTKEQIKISLDRLTRFKPTEDKYLRVFKDIILSNLIVPKYKKKDLDLMPYQKITALAEIILNESLNTKSKSDYSVNKKLFAYEKSVFKFDKNVEILLKNKINYNAAIKLLDYKKIPNNLKWLKSLADNGNQIKERETSSLTFPVERVVIVEGITEEILLPKFAKICGLDFDKNGIYLISAGGKNQVVKLFYQFAEILKLPIFVLLDSDAGANYEEIKPKLRKGDKVYVIEKGEFEDILPLSLIKRALNKNFREYFSVGLDDLRSPEPMVYILTEVFKSAGQEFKKAEFAHIVESCINGANDITKEIQDVLNYIFM